MPTTLDEILAATRRRVAEVKPLSSRAELANLASRHTPRGFTAALRRASAAGVAVIAELKKASPSRGVIRGSFHVSALATQLAEAGAAAISVLTEEEFFHGTLTNLTEASACCPLPLLCKDFIVDDFQILEARAHGADAVLLILAALSEAQFKQFLHTAREYALDVLCEVHTEEELGRALDAGCELVGVNSRDLRTFQVDMNTAFRLVRNIPPGVLKVAESGIQTGEELQRLRAAGYEAFLIGESLMKADFPGEALRKLLAEVAAAA
jgi:indole-3-glycerol phosphate synthase